MKRYILMGLILGVLLFALPVYAAEPAADEPAVTDQVSADAGEATDPSITIEGEEFIIINEPVQFKANISPSGTNMDIVWSSSWEYVATVNQEGVVEGMAEGSTWITAKSKEDSDITAGIEVRVVNHLAESLEILSAPKTIPIDEQAYIMYKITPKDAYLLLSWESSNPSVCSVDGGFVTAKKAGTATITAATQDGSKKKASFTIRVVDDSAELENWFTKCKESKEKTNLKGKLSGKIVGAVFGATPPDYYYGPILSYSPSVTVFDKFAGFSDERMAGALDEADLLVVVWPTFQKTGTYTSGIGAYRTFTHLAIVDLASQTILYNHMEAKRNAPSAINLFDDNFGEFEVELALQKVIDRL